VGKTESKPVLSFVEGLVLTIAINNRDIADNIPFGGITAVMRLLVVGRNSGVNPKEGIIDDHCGN